MTGDEALACSQWDTARRAFERDLAGAESPETLEGLALAAWWLDDERTVFDARERAYKRYLDRDDRRSAARVAVWIAWDCRAFRGETAVSNGWLQRARRHLEGLPESPELAWLAARESQLILGDDGDPDRAYRLASDAVRIGRATGAVDYEMLGRSVQGLALVMSGAVAEGMRLLDEVNAAVVAGEMRNQVAIALACCHMIAACDRVRDYDRATEWCARLKAYCERWGFRPLFATCRTQYASICMWRGTWLEAEQELTAAAQEFAASRPPLTADSLVRLGELRRRQGRLVEAASLFGQAEHHPQSALGRAELAFDRGDLREAAEAAERYLRRVPLHNRADRAEALDLLVRALAATGDLSGAKTALAELTAIAALVSTKPMSAAASLGAGYVAMAERNPDEARRHLEDAVDLFLQSGAPFEVARASIELARVLGALGRTDAAIEEAQRAVDILVELRAELDLSRAKALIASLGTATPHAAEPGGGEPRPRDHAGGLTGREIEVLRLVADGLNNQVIAERLFVSEHTIHRHVANIFTKLSVSSRAAAVAQAARRGIL